MNLEIRAVFAEEIEVLAEWRVLFILDLHPEYAPKAEEIRSAIWAYIAQHMKQKRYIGYLGRSAGKIVCAGGCCFTICRRCIRTARGGWDMC